jgi:hypothetical protein
MRAISKNKPPRKADNNLTAIAGQILALEKHNVANVIAIGGLLEQAAALVEHGEYMAWLLANFGWSHGTSLNYRKVYQLTQNRKICDFDQLNISLSALYLAAQCIDQPAICDAILDTARTGRVSYSTAKRIVEEHETAAEPPRDPEEDEEDESEDEPAGDESNDDAADDDGDADDGAGRGEEKKSADSRKKKGEEWLVSSLRSLHSGLDHLKVDLQKVIVEVGPIEMREIVTRLQAALDEHASKNVLQAKADRTETTAKAKRGEKIPAPAVSDDNASAAWKATTKAAAPADFPDLPAALDRKLH